MNTSENVKSKIGLKQSRMAGSHLAERWGRSKKGLRNLLGTLAANRPICGSFCYHSYLQVFLHLHQHLLKIVIRPLGLLEFKVYFPPHAFSTILLLLTCWANFQPCSCDRNSRTNTRGMSCLWGRDKPQGCRDSWAGIVGKAHVHSTVQCLQPLNQAVRESSSRSYLFF